MLLIPATLAYKHPAVQVGIQYSKAFTEATEYLKKSKKILNSARLFTLDLLQVNYCHACVWVSVLPLRSNLMCLMLTGSLEKEIQYQEAYRHLDLIQNGFYLLLFWIVFLYSCPSSPYPITSETKD